MGRRGPLPEPTAAKRAKGNPGHRPLPDDEPEPVLLEQVPDPPDWMDGIAADAWRFVARELHNAKMLHALDQPILELFCVAYKSWREILKELDNEGYTYRAYDDHGNLKFAQQTPEATLASKLSKDINTWAKVLGLGPAYRVGLRVGSSEGQAAKDPIAEALAGSTVGNMNPPPKKSVARKPTKKAPQKTAAKPKG